MFSKKKKTKRKCNPDNLLSTMIKYLNEFQTIIETQGTNKTKQKFNE